jgi:hypothetical protein
MEEPAADGIMVAEKSRHHDIRYQRREGHKVIIFNGIKTEHPSKRGAEISFFP